jgi:Family of unknown function (DUF5678)
MKVSNINWDKTDRMAVMIAGGVAIGSAVATLPGVIVGGVIAAGCALYIDRKEASVEVDDRSRDLFWSEPAFNYITKQGEIFDAMMDELVQEYAGKYVLFEDGKVIDADEDEDRLLDRVWETDFVKDRIAKYNGVFCHLVPMEVARNA